MKRTGFRFLQDDAWLTVRVLLVSNKVLVAHRSYIKLRCADSVEDAERTPHSNSAGSPAPITNGAKNAFQ